MSIHLMSRLFKHKMGHAHRKLLAIRMADHADDDGRGIWPAVDTLAEQTELSVRTVQRIISDFLDEGILVLRHKASGRPGETNRYDFDLDVLFRAPDVPEEATKTGDSVTPVEPETGVSEGGYGCQPVADGCHGDTRTVKEPSKNLQEGEREAREREDRSDDREKATKAFKRWYPTWPTYVDDSEPKALKAWLELDGDERQEAAEKSGDYVEACRATGRKHICSAQVYLAERRWKKLEAMRKDEPKKAKPDLSSGVMVPVFGPAWATARMDSMFLPPEPTEVPLDIRERKQGMFDVLANTSVTRAENWALRNGLSVGIDGRLIFPDGFEMQEAERREREEGWPEANRLHEAAKSQNHVRVAAIYERMKCLCEAVPVGSAMWQRWAEWHERNNRPFVPEPKGMQVVYFPKGGPDGLDDFIRALAAAQNEASDDAA